MDVYMNKQRVKTTWTMGMAVAVLGFVAIGCGGKDKKDDANPAEAQIPREQEERMADGQIILKFDNDGDGKADVIKTLEEYPDPDDPAVTLRRTRKMEMDVNSDGKINIIRDYDDAGTLRQESSDTNLDGSIELVAYYEKGKLVKKEHLDPKTGRITDHRYYANGNLLRLERDTNNDDKIDYWEYYTDGTLERIGRDFNGDGRADSWQKR